MLLALTFAAAIRPGVEWLTRRRVPEAAAILVFFVGALGTLGLFFWLAGICLGTAAILLLVVPERPAARAKDSLGDQFRITGAVLTDGFYWRITPLLAVQQLAFIGSISLWIGPWLRDVGGFADKEVRADIQLLSLIHI